MAETPLQPRAHAVFLSYAHEDIVAARRIAEALRAFGLEVWFDANELRGGDQWDSKIRKQIKGCALFVLIISANTQSHAEGNFRREWKLAVDRTHDMADGRAFLVPVLVDDTPEYNAIVPDGFSSVQWTRLPGGEPDSKFISHVKNLATAEPAPPAARHGHSPQEGRGRPQHRRNPRQPSRANFRSARQRRAHGSRRRTRADSAPTGEEAVSDASRDTFTRITRIRIFFTVIAEMSIRAH